MYSNNMSIPTVLILDTRIKLANLREYKSIPESTIGAVYNVLHSFYIIQIL